MIDAMKMKRSIYFATLQGYVIFETKLYINDCVMFVFNSEVLPFVLSCFMFRIIKNSKLKTMKTSFSPT